MNIEQMQIQRYSQSPIAFCNDNVKINTIEGLKSFSPREEQAGLLQAFDQNRFVICKGDRQSGKTTTALAYILHYALFNEYSHIAIFSYKQAAANELLHRLAKMYDNLPKYLSWGIINQNKSSVMLGNGTSIEALPVSSDLIRGQTYSLVYLDEMAFMPQADLKRFFESVYPTIVTTKFSKILIASSTNGLNEFSDLWENAKLQNNKYVPIEIHQ